jgi:hypothetical protein
MALPARIVVAAVGRVLGRRLGHVAWMMGRNKGQQPGGCVSNSFVYLFFIVWKVECEGVTRDNSHVHFDGAPDAECGVVVRQLLRVGWEPDPDEQDNAG